MLATSCSVLTSKQNAPKIVLGGPGRLAGDLLLGHGVEGLRRPLVEPRCHGPLGCGISPLHGISPDEAEALVDEGSAPVFVGGHHFWRGALVYSIDIMRGQHDINYLVGGGLLLSLFQREDTAKQRPNRTLITMQLGLPVERLE